MIPIIGWMIGAYIFVRALDMKYIASERGRSGFEVLCVLLMFFDGFLMFGLLVKGALL